MQSNTVDVTTLSDTELKALAYDNIQQRDALNESLQIIQNEMNARVNRANEAVLEAATKAPVEGEVIAPKTTKKATKK